MMQEKIFESVEPWLAVAAVGAAAIVLAFLAHRLLFIVLNRVVRRTAGVIDDSIVRHANRPAWLIITLLAVIAILPGLDVSEGARAVAGHLLSLSLTAAFGWLAFSLTRSIKDVTTARYDLGAADNLRAREVHTRVDLLQRVLGVIILAVTVSVLLMAIPGVRQIGITLFASAGIAGIVVGFAARPVLSNMFAGIQLALAQPIRIDDVVIVEGEWGWIEEIRMTFVVVRVWDRRRLVVPLTYFIEKPFQNWTRKSADILGTVFLYTDYTVPVSRIREALHHILRESPLWDGEVWGLQVTNATERGVELRALMGARNSGDAWDLRCQVRERLIEFLQREYPHALPRLRADIIDQAPSLIPERNNAENAGKETTA